MKFQFDANQQYQLDAIRAVVDLFDGQPRGEPEYSVIRGAAGPGFMADAEHGVMGAGNRLVLDSERLRTNTRTVQARNDIDVAEPAAALESWTIPDPPAGGDRLCPHFSVEMETGTGKTYVYLRTIYELARQYGLRKFVIVVPSVAIREGVLKNLEVTADHFRALYDNMPCEHFVYDAKRLSRLRQFATSNTVQIMVINIDAFRKNFSGTEDEQKSNVIYKESDRLSGRQPIEFIQAARPIVIIDEPQSVDSTPKAQEAISALNPLCTLRYSATHRNLYNLVYRLDPVQAFRLELVKQISVGSAQADGGANDPFVRLDTTDHKTGLKARLRIHKAGATGPREGRVTAKAGSDLFKLSGELEIYAHGWEVVEISNEPGGEFIAFSNGTRLGLGEERGGMREDLWREQIRGTVKEHLEHELRLAGRGIKVLSLFFLDRVANYREYDDSGQPRPGRFAAELEAILTGFGKDPRYQSILWLTLPLASLHNGYFSQDRHGVLKDTRGDTQADDNTYDLIMKDKERLLSEEEPLRFIFSHSALREGWDNPNVFQICTLNATVSAVKKRQEIGRGLRLPVDQSGQRVWDASVNRLFVMANESYEEFAATLQQEYEDDCGVTFGKVPLAALARLVRVVEDREEPIGPDAARQIRDALVDQGLLSIDGRILPAFNPAGADFRLLLPEALADLTPGVIDLLNAYRIERHIRRASQSGINRFKKKVALGPEFQSLWDRIKPRTTYRVEFDSQDLVSRAVDEIGRMAPIVAPTITVRTGRLDVTEAGVLARASRVARESVLRPGPRPIPDILAYLQNETDLTRSTLARILTESGRLAELFQDPQRFLDQVAAITNHVLHRLLVDGIKYERLEGAGGEWEMQRFRNEELIDYLSAIQVKGSVYEYVVWDSEIEREFASQLDQREDIKLFVKLPRWFTVDTPLGPYNPDWAILKQDGQTLYLARETKSTRDFLKLRTSEADKVRCGARHFDALGVDFKVAVTADEV
ncbi:MAG: DEAD/DEAH box helicase family protein [Gemmatimonadota bacterium]|nr:DEAD/DEAH box helicase family protein [Gemmatimonadota bacterium]